jgi:hypothetical protein
VVADPLAPGEAFELTFEACSIDRELGRRLGRRWTEADRDPFGGATEHVHRAEGCTGAVEHRAIADRELAACDYGNV